ncbi:hypothetical protein GCM10022284_49310 [Streptomyces hundungensis]
MVLVTVLVRPVRVLRMRAPSLPCAYEPPRPVTQAPQLSSRATVLRRVRGRRNTVFAVNQLIVMGL